MGRSMERIVEVNTVADLFFCVSGPACSPWEGRWIGDWRTTWSTTCSSAPDSQAAEEAIPYLYKQERKRPTTVRRRLSRTQAHLGRVIPGGGCRCRGWKCGVLWGCPSTSHSIGDPPTAPHVCCCCQMSWWVVVRRVQMGVSIWGAVHLYSGLVNGWLSIGWRKGQSSLIET